ncbi:MAG: hypothetical protein HYY16_18590 [Planctomycetes bacterium]|nr:hypothetical protein [Planctomycetota bacterium]
MKHVLWSSLALISVASFCEAQTKPRWKLDMEHEKPQMITYRGEMDQLENCWFFVYTLTNNTDEVIPLHIDIMLYTEVGKDLQHDVRKVDPEPTKATLEDARKYPSLKFGRFITDAVVPQAIEYKIIETHAKLGNRSPGIVQESIEELKAGFKEDPTAPDVKGRWKAGDRLYLNSREMRRQRFIKSGQKLQGIAIFRNVDPRGRILEIYFSGLWDPIRVEGYEPGDVKMVYENKVLRIAYEFKGDEYERERDVLAQTRREWVVKAIGPVASKETLNTLIETMLERLKQEEHWASGEVPAEDVETAKKREPLTPVDLTICARIVRAASGKDFGYDSEKSILDNKAAIWRIHEWWVTHRSRLAFNEATGRFEPQDEKLPGRQD